MTWTIVGLVLIVIILAVWIGNTVWWTKRNGTLKRKSPLSWAPENYESKPAVEHDRDRLDERGDRND
ncbi:hypothetical protein [uncultured Modestobacter sp.]|uniref:hypothetical protein n=1 Tax=uncultured Modestobacter sp. TaxID=380048 RepID=UPI0026213E72|nr:hypothetical protein [uncultured Modestobacter sp.]